MEKVETLVGEYGSQGHSVGKHLTWADLFIHETTCQVMKYSEEVVGKFPKLSAIRETVEKNEKIAKYLKNRPVTQY